MTRKTAYIAGSILTIQAIRPAPFSISDNACRHTICHTPSLIASDRQPHRRRALWSPSLWSLHQPYRTSLRSQAGLQHQNTILTMHLVVLIQAIAAYLPGFMNTIYDMSSRRITFPSKSSSNPGRGCTSTIALYGCWDCTCPKLHE